MGSQKFSATTYVPAVKPELVYHERMVAEPKQDGHVSGLFRPSAVEQVAEIDDASGDVIRAVIVREKVATEGKLRNVNDEIDSLRHRLADALARQVTLEDQVLKYASFLDNKGGED